MPHRTTAPYPLQQVSSFQELVNTPFQGEINAICWPRVLPGNFAEIVQQVHLHQPIEELSEAQLLSMALSPAGQQARDILLQDLHLLQAHGAQPVLNFIQYYEEEEPESLFPTDVYSYHVDRSPVPTDTILCTYYGDASELLPHAQAEQKVLVPEIRAALWEQYTGAPQDFEAYLAEHFYDLHYRAKPQALPTRLGLGHLCRLAVDYPGSPVLPCIHRAPREHSGLTRLLLIC